MNEIFHKFSVKVSKLAGSPWMFVGAVLLIVIWLLTGPIFQFSDTWQLVINTGTTIVTFLMVFLIQNTQNRESKAVQLKLDELIRAIDGARNQLVDLENMDDADLERLQKQFARLHEQEAYSQKNEPRPTQESA